MYGQNLLVFWVNVKEWATTQLGFYQKIPTLRFYMKDEKQKFVFMKNAFQTFD